MFVLALVISALVPQLSHDGRPSSIAFSSDGKRLVTCGFRTLKEWDLTSGRLLRTLDIGGGSLCAVSKSAIAHAGLNEVVRVLSLDGKELQRLTHERTVTSLAFSPDGKTLVTGAKDGVARLWDLKKERAKITLAGDVVVATDAKRAFAASASSLVAIDLASGKELWRVETKALPRAIVSDGKSVVVTSKERVVHYDVAKGKTLAETETKDAAIAGHTQVIERDGTNTTIALSPDEKRVAIGGDSEIRVGTLVLGGARPVRGAYFATNEIVVSERSDGVEAWVRATGRTLAVLSGHDRYALSDDGLTLFSAAGVFDVKSGEQRAAFVDGCKKVSAVTTSGDEKTVLFGCDDGSSVTFEVSGKKLASTPPVARSVGGLLHVALSHDGKLAASATIGRQSGARVGSVALALEDGESVSGLTFNRSARWLLTWWQNQLRAWDVRTGQPAKTVELVEAENAFYSPDRSLVVMARPNAAPLFLDTETLEARALPVSASERFAFADDGKLLVTDATTLRVIDAKNGRVLETMPKPPEGKLSPDRKSVLVVGPAVVGLVEIASGVKMERVSSKREWIVQRGNGEIAMSSEAAKGIAIVE